MKKANKKFQIEKHNIVSLNNMKQINGGTSVSYIFLTIAETIIDSPEPKQTGKNDTSKTCQTATII